MDGSQASTYIHPQLESSNKRPISRVSSSPPSQAQASKRVCHQQDNQLVDALMVYQPTPQSATSQAVAFLEEVAASQESTQSLELVDNWLEETYPSELREKHSRSDGFLHPVDDIPLLLRRPQSAPAIMSGNANRRGSAQNFGQTPTPLSSTRGGQAGQAASPAPTTTAYRTGSVVDSPRYRDTNLAENNILLRDSRSELPRHISALVSSVQQDRASPLPSPSTVKDNHDLYAMEMEASEAEVEDFFRNNVAPRTSREDPIRRSDRITMNKTANRSTKSATQFLTCFMATTAPAPSR